MVVCSFCGVLGEGVVGSPVTFSLLIVFIWRCLCQNDDGTEGLYSSASPKSTWPATENHDRSPLRKKAAPLATTFAC